MEELLFLAHRIPYPPNKGDKIRSYHLLRHLSQYFTVHLAAFVDDENDWKYAEALNGIVSGSIRLLPLNPRQATLRSAAGLLAGVPLTLPYYHDPELRRWVKRLLAERPIHKAMAYSSGMAQYLEPYPELHRVVDFVDIDSDKWQQYAVQKSWPMSWIYRREARTLLGYECRIAGSFNAATFVSAREAEAFRQQATGCADRIDYFNNGVDLEYFSPDHELQSPYREGQRVLVFTGAMDYWANVDAVIWFASEIFPALRSQFPDLLFYIVGSRPTEKVLALAGNGVVVTGSVADVRPFLAHAAISVAPLRIARGIQNKVLEAMSMAKPVIASLAAIEGIEAIVGQEILLAEDATAFIARISAQLTEPDERLGQAARMRMAQSYDWESSLQRLDALLGLPRDHT